MPDAIGLDQYMREAYRILVRERECTTEQVAAQLGIPCLDARKTVERLAAVGLAATAPTSSDEHQRLVPLDPQRTLAVKLARKQAELKAEQQELSRARESVASLVAEFTGSEATATDPRNLSRGSDAVRARAADLLGRAQSELVAIVDDRARSIAFELEPDLFESALNRGVQVRVLHPRSNLTDPQYVSRSRWLSSAGGQVRTSTSLPPPMLVVDGTTALLPADGAGATGLVVHNRPLCRALSMLFDQLWTDSGTAGSRPAQTAARLAAASKQGASAAQDMVRAPTQTEVELLRLLGKGMTDASAARQLGVSLRTVRRMMADLMSRLGARSRFEAGLRAAEHGWLGQPNGARVMSRPDHVTGTYRRGPEHPPERGPNRTTERSPERAPA